MKWCEWRKSPRLKVFNAFDMGAFAGSFALPQEESGGKHTALKVLKKVESKG